MLDSVLESYSGRLADETACATYLRHQLPVGRVNAVAMLYLRMRARVNAVLMISRSSPLYDGAAGGGSEVNCLRAHGRDYGYTLTSNLNAQLYAVHVGGDEVNARWPCNPRE